MRHTRHHQADNTRDDPLRCQPKVLYLPKGYGSRQHTALSDVHGIGKSLTLVLYVHPQTIVERIIGSPASSRSQPNRRSLSTVVGAGVNFVRPTGVSLESHNHAVVDKVGIDIVALRWKCTICFLTYSDPNTGRVARHLPEWKKTELPAWPTEPNCAMADPDRANM